jgi:mannose-6-phosphate isomerase-like protein (cupin superfamily)
MTKDIFYENVEKTTLKNDNYRKVEYTHPGGMQFVLMSLKPGVEIGMEIHKDHDQFIRIEKGNGIAQIKKGNSLKKYKLSDGYAIIIPSGTYHNIINTGKTKLKLYSIYTPPEHKDKLVQKEKPVEKIQKGGEVNIYKQKYLKYKNKYLQLKNNI